MTATEERQLRRALHGTLQSVSPPSVPLEAIVRRGRGVRLRARGPPSARSPSPASSP